jgi:hypothetical protein
VRSSWHPKVEAAFGRDAIPDSARSRAARAGSGSGRPARNALLAGPSRHRARGDRTAAGGRRAEGLW